MHELVSALIEIDRHIEEAMRIYEAGTSTKSYDAVEAAYKARKAIVESLTEIKY